MESRSKVAAATASVVPFHCVICFDEFNLKDRTPMVLPCGHTYVCCQCTKRLKRCMECREPLFITATPAIKANNNHLNHTSLQLNHHHVSRTGSSGGNGSPPPPGGSGGVHLPQVTTLHLPPSHNHHHPYNHHHHHHHPNNPNAAVEKIPLPIPKNVVLMAMMEASQRQQAEEQQKKAAAAASEGSDDEEDEEFNLDRIISGMATLSGPCGTYSVACDGGLRLFQEDPRKQQKPTTAEAENVAAESPAYQKQEGGAQEGSGPSNDRQKENRWQQFSELKASSGSSNDRVTVEDEEEEKKVEVERENSMDMNNLSLIGGGIIDCEGSGIEESKEGDDGDYDPVPLCPVTRTSIEEDEDNIEVHEEEAEDDGEEDDSDVSSVQNNINFDNGNNNLGVSSSSPPPPMSVLDVEVDDAKQKSQCEADASAEPVVMLKKGQTVQVVDFQDGVARLARGKGYIVATSKQLVKVGGPMEVCCRLEGLLETIESRGQDLQSTLDENKQVEANLRKQIEVELTKDPSHPVIVAPPDFTALSSESRDSEGSQPLTPTGESSERHKENNSASLRTPDKSIPRDNSLVFPPHGSPPGSNQRHPPGHSPAPRSPNSIDNADITRSGMPGYRRAVSEDDLDNLSFGCGAAFLGQNANGLWGETLQHSLHQRVNETHLLRTGSSDNYSVNSVSIAPSNSQLGPRSMADTLLMHASPTLTSSFDGVDFRTGMSGHRGLSNAAKAGHSPTTRGRQVRLMMSSHNGIGRVRTVPSTSGSRNSPTQQSAGPSFGPRFSPFPGT